MFSVLRFCLPLVLLAPLLVWGQDAPQSVAVEARYIPAPLRAAHDAYAYSANRMSPPEYQEAFVRAFFRSALKRETTLYADSLFSRTVDPRSLDRELYFLKEWMRGKRSKAAAQLPDYQIRLSARELWFLENGKIKGWNRAFVRVEVVDALKPELAAVRYYLKPEAVEKLLPAADWMTDYADGRGGTLLDCWLRHDLCFSVAPTPGPLPDGWTAAWQSRLRQDRAERERLFSPTQFVIPTGRHELSAKAGWTDSSAARWDRSVRIVRIAAPQLMRHLLTGKLRAYTTTGVRDRHAAKRQGARLAAENPALPPVDRRTALTQDYSGFIHDLEVTGELIVGPSGVTFTPLWVSLVWGGRIDDPLKEVVATFRVRDLKRLGVSVDGVPLEAALAEWRSYYQYLFTLNDAHLQTLEEAAVADACLRARRPQWLPSQGELKEWSQPELRMLLQRCAGE